MTITESPATPQDLQHLRHAIRIATEAKQAGNHPFGAILVSKEDQVLMTSPNCVRTEQDSTAHAERKLMTMASQKFSPEILSSSTMYTSAEPCAMCAGSVYWTGISRVVYGLSEKRLDELIGQNPENLCLDLPCRIVFNSGKRSIQISGPHLEDEAAKDHVGFW